MTVIGIDGGGTKTTCVLSRAGKTVATATAGASNLVRIADGEARIALHQVIREACVQAGISVREIEAACIGLGGASRSMVADRVREILSEVLSCPIEIVGDIVIALDAVTIGGPGVVVISGTGSIAYGRNDNGVTARAGGLGSVISDEGSGYWIGRSAVSACFNALDSDRSTSLKDAILQKWKLTSLDELVIKANAASGAPFAELAPVVMLAAEAGDNVAREILRTAGNELAVMAKRVLDRLWEEDAAVTVAMSGGIFQNSAIVRDSFIDSLRKLRSSCDVELSSELPVMGAVFRAQKLLSQHSSQKVGQ